MESVSLTAVTVSGDLEDFSPEYGIPVWNEIYDPNKAFLRLQFLNYNSDLSDETFGNLNGLIYRYLRSEGGMS